MGVSSPAGPRRESRARRQGTNVRGTPRASEAALPVPPGDSLAGLSTPGEVLRAASAAGRAGHTPFASLRGCAACHGRC